MVLSSRHYSAIRLTLYDGLDSNDPMGQKYIWPIVNYQRASGMTFGQMKEYIDQAIQVMYSLNVCAYAIEYNDPFDQNEKVSFEPAQILTAVGLFKALDCWHYNSANALENAAPIQGLSQVETDQLAMILETFDHMAKRIVREMPEYNAAKWSL